MTLLEVESLDMAYAGRRGQAPVQVLRNVSFKLAAGETLGIVGESGSGKSTLAAALVRLLAPGAKILAGSIRFEGEDLMRLSERAMRGIRGSRIATILQDPLNSLNPLMSIGNQVAEAPRIHGQVSKAAAWDRARALIGAVRIASPNERLREFPHQLSGGMRQRVAGAIALSCSPRLLIADEPTTALDPTVQAQYLQLLKDLQREHGFALILITHDLGVVGRVCDRVAVMYAGRLVEQGPTLATLREPRHPYTAALLASLPRLPALPGTLRTIQGQPPDPAHPPAGCPFHPRCPQAMARCSSDMPPNLQLTPDREAACWLNVP
jgi:oligopeptide/dipeptide ABC transporter ATP-binding protein